MDRGSTSSRNDTTNNNNNHNSDTDVMFLGNASKSFHFNSHRPTNGKRSGQNNNYENSNLNDPCQTSNNLNTCKTLHRKLEMKVERAKRNYSQFNNSQPKVRQPKK